MLFPYLDYFLIYSAKAFLYDEALVFRYFKFGVIFNHIDQLQNSFISCEKVNLHGSAYLARLKVNYALHKAIDTI